MWAPRKSAESSSRHVREIHLQIGPIAFIQAPTILVAPPSKNLVLRGYGRQSQDGTAKFNHLETDFVWNADWEMATLQIWVPDFQSQLWLLYTFVTFCDQVWQVGLLDLDIYGPSLPELVRWGAWTWLDTAGHPQTASTLVASNRLVMNGFCCPFLDDSSGLCFTFIVSWFFVSQITGLLQPIVGES